MLEDRVGTKPAPVTDMQGSFLLRETLGDALKMNNGYTNRKHFNFSNKCTGRISFDWRHILTYPLFKNITGEDDLSNAIMSCSF